MILTVFLARVVIMTSYDCKAMYSAINLELAEAAFESLKEKWGSDYPGAVRVWDNNFNHVRQLFNYPADIRKVMYTTNAIESVNSSLRKVTKKGFFENENSVFKILNQLSCLDETSDRIARYIR